MPKCMEWLRTVMKFSGIKKPVEFGRAVNKPHSYIYQLLDRDSPQLKGFLTFLCKCRKAANDGSGMTWEQLGAMLDAEYLDNSDT